MSHSTALGDSVMPDEPRNTFTRTLGTGSIVFMVVAAAAPLTVVGGTVPLVFSMSESVGVPSYYLLAALVLAIFAVGFTAMSRFVKNAGAFYSYIQAGLGKIAGVGAATLALFSYFVLLIAVYAYCGAAVTNALEHYFAWTTPWWLWTLLIVAIVAFLGYRNIELSSKVLGFLLLAEVAVILILNIAVIARGGEAGLVSEPFNPAVAVSGNAGIGLMFAFFGFIGFEATAVFRNETKDPDRTIPKATYIAVISIGVFYAFSSWAIAAGSGVSNIIADSTADPEGLVVTLATSYVGAILGDIIQVLLVTSLFACVLSFHNVVTRYQYSLGSQGVLPRRLGVVHGVHNSPSFSSLFLSVVSAIAMIIVAVIGLDPVVQIYAWLSGAATLGLMILMALTSIAVISYFARHSTGMSAVRTLVAPAVAFLGVAAVTTLVLSNFPLLVGSTTAAFVMAAIVFLSFFVGVGLALRLRHSVPDTYRGLDDAIVTVPAVS